MSVGRRVAGGAGVALVTAASLIVSAEGASAMPTFSCSQKGTSSGETLVVEVPAGHTTSASPWVVCAGNGDDTIVINDVTEFGPAYLYLAMGNGQKTIIWNGGDIAWGADQGPIPGGGIITRPAANPDIIMGGTDTASPGAWMDCGTNVQYRAAADQWALHIATGFTELYWNASQQLNNNHC